METVTAFDVFKIILWTFAAILGVIVLILTISKSYVIVNQGSVKIITRFGKFQKIAAQGLSFKVPFIDTVYGTISLQNISQEAKFQAVTLDQANVYFNAMMVISALDTSVETIQKIAFKFRSKDDFYMALIRMVESSVRGYVSTRKQSEVLQLRNEIIEHIKTELDAILAEWGYHLHNLQMNDISFDREIMDSMSRVVASANLKAAAENEGQALLIKKTKEAEADGNAIKIAAAAEKEAAKLRGEGVALFRESVAKGIGASLKELNHNDNATEIIMLSMWTESMQRIATEGKGNVMYFDGSPDNMKRIVNNFQASSLMTSK